MTVLAHAGHWLVSMIYAAPALLLAGALLVSTIRHRRREAARRAAGALDEPGEQSAIENDAAGSGERPNDAAASVEFPGAD